MKVISSKFSFDTSNIIGLNSELKAMYCYEMFKKVNKGPQPVNIVETDCKNL